VRGQLALAPEGALALALPLGLLLLLLARLHSGWQRQQVLRQVLLLLLGPQWWGAGTGYHSAHRTLCLVVPGRISVCSASP
jgi:hypothetical protein